MPFRPFFRSYKPADEAFEDLVIPEAVPKEIGDRVKEELEQEHAPLKMENLVTICSN